MPELPEVETLKLGLQKYIVGKTIESVDVIDPKLFEGSAAQTIGAQIVEVKRYAKGIVIELDNGYSIAVHIKLTGQLIYRDETNRDMLVMKPTPLTVPNKFTRAVFKLKDQSAKIKTTVKSSKLPSPQPSPTSGRGSEAFLYFQEVRGFAWMRVVKTSDIPEMTFFKGLGPEPIPSPGSNTPLLTEEMLEKILAKSGLAVKVVLMDQKRIGGIGNIYANDSLFDAGIDPRRKAKEITSIEVQRLFKSILKVLETGMKYKGSSELNYVNVLGETGEYQKHALIYGRKGKPCTVCGNAVQKIYLGGRGTFFCTTCQH